LNNIAGDPINIRKGFGITQHHKNGEFHVKYIKAFEKNLSFKCKNYKILTPKYTFHEPSQNILKTF
jgi:hypothetical protein